MIHPSPHSGPAFRGLRIGLLGGSVNPAHGGHVAMSLFALKKLRLDQVWWLVSPQNPLKTKAAPLGERLAQARLLTRANPRLVVTDLETKLGTRFTLDTLKALQKRMPATRFVWLMGADNLRQFSRWHRWEALFRAVPIAVFRRSGYGAGGKAAQHFQAARRDARTAAIFATQTAPAWIMLDNKLNALSATRLRQQSKGS